MAGLMAGDFKDGRYTQEEMQRIIMNHGNSMDIAAQARKEAVKSLRDSGLLKVKQGLTSLEEVLSTTNL